MEYVDGRFEMVFEGFEIAYAKIDQLTARVDRLEARMDQLEITVAVLVEEVRAIRAELKEKVSITKFHQLQDRVAKVEKEVAKGK